MPNSHNPINDQSVPIQDWQNFIQTGRLQAIDPRDAQAMLESLSKLESQVREFLEAHERTLETLEYEDEFKKAIQRFIEYTQAKMQSLQAKPISELTADDRQFLESMAVLLGEESRLQRIPMKENSPQEQLRNQIGVWKEMTNEISSRYEQYYGERPPFHPQPL